MKHSLRLSVVATTLGLLSGCGFSSGFIRDSNSAQHFDYRFDISGLRYLRTASGSSSTGSILCLIPLSGNLYEQAMEKLNATADLSQNQVITNLREDSSIRSYLGFYCTRQLTVSGDVVELIPAPTAAPAGAAPRAAAPAPMAPTTPTAPPPAAPPAPTGRTPIR